MGKYFPESLCRSVSGCIAVGLVRRPMNYDREENKDEDDQSV